MKEDKRRECIRLLGESERAAEIVRRAEAFAEEQKESIRGHVRDEKKGEGKRQFNSLVEAAAQTCCIDEFKLYIAYKGAKEGTRGIWKELTIPFNQEVDGLRGLATDLVKDSDGVLESKDMEDVHLEVLRRFVGYLMWKANILIAEK